MNLLTLLLYRWREAIKFIQSCYRKYKLVKLARIQIMYIKCMKSSIRTLAIFSKSPKIYIYEIISKFILNESYKYSRSKCKYLYDIRSVNKKFTRNFSFWESEMISTSLGRNFQISLPPPPKLSLFLKTEELVEIFENLNKTSRKLIRRRSIAQFS